MEEIGRHFKFEPLLGNHNHTTELLLSSGRNCLRYILREKNIQTIYLPFFLCESLSEVANKENTTIQYYHIDENLLPIGIKKEELNENTYLYFVNYYGLLTDKIDDFIEEYKYVIVDNTHNFFDRKEHNADIIYNYRKYWSTRWSLYCK